MKKPIDIRYVHAGDLTTNAAHALEWVEGTVADRYQEIAIVGDRVIGSWQYGLEWHRGKARIHSGHTGVAPRYRRRGVARMLWLHGIARWKPTRIASTIATDEGRAFLARMTAEIAYRAPGTWLCVKTRKEDTGELWESMLAYEAKYMLEQLGRAAPKAIAAPQPLKLIKAGQ